jgi:hypothetical protein
MRQVEHPSYVGEQIGFTVVMNRVADCSVTSLTIPMHPTRLATTLATHVSAFRYAAP